jgi:DNA repair photolyase
VSPEYKIVMEGIRAKSILNRSSIGDYCVNPYIGCSHACSYCYAQYYTRRMGYSGAWGSYVYAKLNAIELLEKEILRKARGVVYISSLTDAYQPAESSFSITRGILKLLLERDWPIIIQTKSSLVLRDLDIISGFSDASVGLTIITLDDELRRALEPRASSVKDRIYTLQKLKEDGIRTFTFIGPIIPGAALEDILALVKEVKGLSDLIYFDRFRVKPGISMGEMSTEDLNAYYRRIKASLSEKLRGVNHIFLY